MTTGKAKELKGDMGRSFSPVEAAIMMHSEAIDAVVELLLKNPDTMAGGDEFARKIAKIQEDYGT